MIVYIYTQSDKNYHYIYNKNYMNYNKNDRLNDNLFFKIFLIKFCIKG